MSMKKKWDAVVVVGEYVAADGTPKKKYKNVGAVLVNDKGQESLKLDLLPVEFNGWINFYEPKEHAQGAPTPQASIVEDGFSDPIPF